jgi:hypothetical protein
MRRSGPAGTFGPMTAIGWVILATLLLGAAVCGFIGFGLRRAQRRGVLDPAADPERVRLAGVAFVAFAGLFAGLALIVALAFLLI